MSVLIKGMKMPKAGQVIEIAQNADGKTFARVEPSFDPWHEIIEVPTPHGRLIDADKLDRAFSDLRWQDGDWQTGEMVHWGDRSDWCLQGIEVETLIKNAPTIIKAEEEKRSEEC